MLKLILFLKKKLYTLYRALQLHKILKFMQRIPFYYNCRIIFYII